MSQKYRLYSRVRCISGREALREIDGLEVTVIGYRNARDLGFVYSVSLGSKEASTFECFERELHPPETLEKSWDVPYGVIRSMLRSHLHQDFDLHHDSVADAIHAAIRRADKEKLGDAIERLENERDEVIAEVLSDHEVPIWDEITPRELLITIRTLLKLS